MEPGIIILLEVILIAISFGAGWLTRKEKDSPVYIPNDKIAHNSAQPHVHAHDFGKDGKLINLDAK
jgi:hypothetical protein